MKFGRAPATIMTFCLITFYPYALLLRVMYLSISPTEILWPPLRPFLQAGICFFLISERRYSSLILNTRAASFVSNNLFDSMNVLFNIFYYYLMQDDNYTRNWRECQLTF